MFASNLETEGSVSLSHTVRSWQPKPPLQYESATKNARSISVEFCQGYRNKYKKRVSAFVVTRTSPIDIFTMQLCSSIVLLAPLFAPLVVGAGNAHQIDSISGLGPVDKAYVDLKTHKVFVEGEVPADGSIQERSYQTGSMYQFNSSSRQAIVQDSC